MHQKCAAWSCTAIYEKSNRATKLTFILCMLGYLHVLSSADFHRVNLKKKVSGIPSISHAVWIQTRPGENRPALFSKAIGRRQHSPLMMWIFYYANVLQLLCLFGLCKTNTSTISVITVNMILFFIEKTDI